MSKAGSRLAEISRLYFAALDDFRLEQNNKGTELRFGAGERIIQWIITPRIESIALEHPPLQVNFYNLCSDDILAKLQNHELDAGVIRSKTKPPRPLKSIRLGVLKYAVFVPDAGSSANRGPNIKMLQNTAYADLTCPKRRELHGKAMMALTGSIITPRYTCTTFPSLAKLIGSGIASGLLPVIAEREFTNKSVMRIDLSDYSPAHETLWLSWNPRMIELAPRREKAINVIGRIIKEQLGKWMNGDREKNR